MNALAKQIVEAVARAYDIESDHIMGSRRTDHLVQARRTAMWLIREILGWSYPRMLRLDRVFRNATLSSGI